MTLREKDLMVMHPNLNYQHTIKAAVVGHNKGGRTGRQIGGRANLLEEVGRIDAERMNPNRRAEKRRVIGELNRGYNKGGRVGLKKVAMVNGFRKLTNQLKQEALKENVHRLQNQDVQVELKL